MKDYILTLLKCANKENPMDRKHIAEINQVPERKIRRIINDIRDEGIRVVSDSESGGYWIAKTEEEYKRFRAEYVSRATKIFGTVKAMDEAVDGQIGGLT